MDTEMKSKVAKVADEFASGEFLQSPKNPVGLSFQPTETDTMFIFTAHLKGYTRGNVKVDLNEDGTKLEVKCKKPVQQTVTLGNKVIKKGVVNRNFTDSLKIPDGVIMDRIEKKFDEKTSILTIKMPKRIKEPELVTQTSSENLPSTADETLTRATFQEDKGAADSESAYPKRIKEPELVTQTSSENLPSTADESLTRATFQEDKGAADSESAYPKGQVEIHGAKDEVSGRETEVGNGKLEFTNLKDEPKDDKVCEEANGIQEDKGAADSESAYPKGQVKKHGAKDEVPGKETKIANDKLECTNLKDEAKDDKVCEKANGIQKEEDKVPKRSKICVPVIVGSTIFLSLVVFVIHYMRKKKQPGKRKE